MIRWLVIAVTALWLMPTAAQAWGDRGHRIVCEIAYARLTEDARAEVDRLMTLDEDYETFAQSCAWADYVRPWRAEEHYVMVPRGFHAFTQEDCPKAETCIISAISDDAARLASAAEPDIERFLALRFLAHWVGDIHQPLHVAFADDALATRIEVTGECEGNLHWVWDTCLVWKAFPDLDTVLANLDALPGAPPALPRFESGAELGAHAARLWANRSFSATGFAMIQYCDPGPGGCWYERETELFSRFRENAMLEDGEPLKQVTYTPALTAIYVDYARQGVIKAGNALAGLLNALLDSPEGGQ